MSREIRVPIKSYKGGQFSKELDFGSLELFSRNITVSVMPGDEQILRSLDSIQLYLSWPGYSTPPVFPIACARMTKKDLAAAVSQEIGRFINKCSLMPIASRHAQWRIGHGAITTDRVIIRSILDMGNNVWQAQLFVRL